MAVLTDSCLVFFGIKALLNLWGPSHACRVDTDVRQANGNRVISDYWLGIYIYNIWWGDQGYFLCEYWKVMFLLFFNLTVMYGIPKPSSSLNNMVITNTGPWFCFSQPIVGCRPGRGFIDAHSDMLAAAADMNRGLQETIGVAGAGSLCRLNVGHSFINEQ